MLRGSSAGFARATSGGRFGRGAEPPSEDIKERLAQAGSERRANA